MFCEVFFESFFEDRQEGEPSAWASLAKGGTADPGITGKRPQNALQHHVKHQRFLSESGCKSTAYYRICKLIPTFFGRFSKGFSQKADLQVCYKAGFPWTEKGTHYNIPGGRAVRARITITITIRGKGHTISVNRRHTGGEHGAQGMKTGCRQGETVVQGGENNGLRKGKQWFSEKKVSPIEEYFFLFQPQKVFPITEKEMKD